MTVIINETKPGGRGVVKGTFSPDPGPLATWLTSLGSLPFIAGALLLASGVTSPGDSVIVLDLTLGYGLAIISFMAGSLWGIQKAGTGATNHAVLLASNAITLAAWAGFFILESQALVAHFCLLFVLLLLIDYRMKLAQRIGSGYFRLRCRITIVVLAALLPLPLLI